MAPPGATLYTPAILAAAAGLAAFPHDPDLPSQGEARARTCGSHVAVALATDAKGRITHIGIRAHACAVGQAAAQVFAAAAAGQTRADLAAARAALEAWLAGTGDLPAWPGLDLIAPARAYPGRHGAILLAWDAALAALS